MSSVNMYIYRRTNTKTKKVYIGQCTRVGNDLRWAECINEALSRRSNSKLSCAIRRDGADSFISEKIYVANSQHELNMMERFFIIVHQSFLSEYGYNMTMGGDGDPKGGKSYSEYYGNERSLEIKKKLSDANYRLRGKKGVWITNGVVNKLVPPDSIPEGFRKGRVQKPYPTGRKDSSETIRKRSISISNTWKKKRSLGVQLCSTKELARLRGLARIAANVRWSKVSLVSCQQESSLEKQHHLERR